MCSCGGCSTTITDNTCAVCCEAVVPSQMAIEQTNATGSTMARSHVAMPQLSSHSRERDPSRPHPDAGCSRADRRETQAAQAASHWWPTAPTHSPLYCGRSDLPSVCLIGRKFSVAANNDQMAPVYCTPRLRNPMCRYSVTDFQSYTASVL